MASSDDDTLALCEGARVILTKNLRVEKGFVNGIMGIVRGFIWRAGADIATDQPHGVRVEFDGEKGQPSPDAPEERSRCVLIFPVTSYYDFEGDECRRTQFPLKLGWAITIHKSQGLTLSRAVVHYP